MNSLRCCIAGRTLVRHSVWTRGAAIHLRAFHGRSMARGHSSDSNPDESLMSRLVQWNTDRIALENPPVLDTSKKTLAGESANHLRKEVMQGMEMVRLKFSDRHEQLSDRLKKERARQKDDKEGGLEVEERAKNVEVLRREISELEEQMTEEGTRYLQQYVEHVLVEREGLSEMEIKFFLETALSGEIDSETGKLKMIPAHKRQDMAPHEEDKEQDNAMSKTHVLDNDSAFQVLRAKGLSQKDFDGLQGLSNLRGEEEFDDQEKVKQQKRLGKHQLELSRKK